MTFTPLFPFAFGGMFLLHAAGSAQAVFRPVEARKEKSGADGTLLSFPPVEKQRFQLPVKGKDGITGPLE